MTTRVPYSTLKGKPGVVTRVVTKWNVANNSLASGDRQETEGTRERAEEERNFVRMIWSPWKFYKGCSAVRTFFHFVWLSLTKTHDGKIGLLSKR